MYESKEEFVYSQWQKAVLQKDPRDHIYKRIIYREQNDQIGTTDQIDSSQI
jgi:hypothetical protein